MQELEVTFGRSAQVWWAFIWRSVLFSALAGAAIGLVVGLISVPFGLNPQKLLPLNLLLGAVAGAVVSVWVVSKILKKKFPTFRIALVQD